MTWIGDGGSSTGAFHEGLNLAAAQRAPFVLVVENNQWAYSTPVARQVPHRKSRGPRRGATGLRAGSWTATMWWRSMRRRRPPSTNAAPAAGPILIEVKTMRMKGHAQHDPAEYVPKEMLEYWKTQDPIARYERYLTENKIVGRKKKSEIDARIERELDEDQKFAEESPMPPPELAEQGVYCDGCHTIEAVWQRPQKEVMPPASSDPRFGR